MHEMHEHMSFAGTHECGPGCCEERDAPWQGPGPGRGRGRGRAAFGGFGPPWAGGMGPLGPRGMGRGRGGPGGRARRGDVRAAVLALLAERPMHGYEIIQELAERTGGIWRPSPGSVYPTLQLLEDEGLVVAEEDSGKRRFSLTETGTASAAEQSARKAPWDEVSEGAGPDALRLREATGQLLGAVVQIGRAGTAEQKAAAETVLAEARRRLYAILAEA